MNDGDDDFDDEADDDADDVSDQTNFPSPKDCQSKGPNTQLLWIYALPFVYEHMYKYTHCPMCTSMKKT